MGGAYRAYHPLALGDLGSVRDWCCQGNTNHAQCPYHRYFYFDWVNFRGLYVYICDSQSK
jgi:hypothetical protein